MLKSEGRIGLLWNQRDERIPWVRKLGTIIGNQDQDVDPTDVLVGSKLFGYVEDATFRHWQPLRKDDLRDLVLSRSNVAVLDPMAQDRVLRKVDDLYEEYDRGPNGLLLPYVTRCYRAVVRPRGQMDEPEHSADLTAAAKAVRDAIARSRATASPRTRRPRSSTSADRAARLGVPVGQPASSGSQPPYTSTIATTPSSNGSTWSSHRSATPATVPPAGPCSPRPAAPRRAPARRRR